MQLAQAPGCSNLAKGFFSPYQTEEPQTNLTTTAVRIVSPLENNAKHGRGTRYQYFYYHNPYSWTETTVRIVSPLENNAKHGRGTRYQYSYYHNPYSWTETTVKVQRLHKFSQTHTQKLFEVYLKAAKIPGFSMEEDGRQVGQLERVR